MRSRPVHRLSKAEAEMQAAIRPVLDSGPLARAKRHKAKIEAYWAERGRIVEVEIEAVTIPNGGDQVTSEYSIRSNIGPDGYPPKAVQE